MTVMTLAPMGTTQAALYQHLDSSVAASIVTDENGNVIQWNDTSGNNRNATLVPDSIGRIRMATAAFPQGLMGLDFDAGGANSNSGLPPLNGDNRLAVAMDLLDATDTATLLNSPNGFSIIMTVDIDGAQDGLANATTDWNDLLGTASTAFNPQSFAIRVAQGSATGGSDGRLAAYLNSQSTTTPATNTNSQSLTELGNGVEEHDYNSGKALIIGLNYQRNEAGGLMTLCSGLHSYCETVSRPAMVTVDGNLVPAEFSNAPSPATPFFNSNQLRLGAMDYNSFTMDGAGNPSRTARFFDGQIGEVQLYDAALSSEEFALKLQQLDEKWTLDYDGALFLDVNREDGQATLKNFGSIPIELIGLTLSSATGSLSSGAWKAISDNYDADSGDHSVDPANTWLKFSQTEFDLTEATNPTGTTSIDAAPSTDSPVTIDLGKAFNTGGTEDVIANYYELTNGDPVRIVVRYIGDVSSVAGDYNSDGAVNAADYSIWRDRLGQSGELPNKDPNDTDNEITLAEYTFWKSRFGATSGGGSLSAAVPESSTLVLAVLGSIFMAIRRRTPAQRIAPLIATLALAVSHSNVASAQEGISRTIDREYLLGDNGVFDDGTNQGISEGAVVGQVVGSNFSNITIDWDGLPGFFDIIFLVPGGDPRYANVSGRPFANGSTIGASFSGDDYLASVFTNPFSGDPMRNGTQPGSEQGGLGKPSQGPNPVSGNDPSGLPRAYNNAVNTRGIQLWVNPSNSTAGHVQDIINDTYQFGIQISDDNKWAMTWGINNQSGNLSETSGAYVVSDTPVDFNQWSHVMQHSPGGGSGVLYVNGVAVAARGFQTGVQFFNVPSTETEPQNLPNYVRNLTVGADLQLNPTFAGTIDDIEVYVSEGTNHLYGRFFLGEDNEYIKNVMAGIPHGDTPHAGDYDGDVDDDDVAFFVAHWGDTQMMQAIEGGVGAVGDLNSRFNIADFNYDGRTDFADWFLLRQNYQGPGGGASLDLGALLAAAGTVVPEPSASALILAALIGCMGQWRRNRLIESFKGEHSCWLPTRSGLR